MRLILASKSLTRKSIMDSLNIKYDIISSNADEISASNDPVKYVEELSVIKAKEVMKKVKTKDNIIIAADSIIYKDGKKYEKPKSIEEAKQTLRELSNTKNQGVTGVTLVDTSNNNMLTFSCVTDVYFKNIS